MSEEQIKQCYERIEKLLNGANKETYGFVPEEIRQILRWYEHSQHIIDELEKRIDKCAEEIINELNENHHLSCGVALGIRQRLINYRELKGSE